MKKPISNIMELNRTLVLMRSVSLAFGMVCFSAASPAAADPSQETLRLGERIYREGILPSGERLRASVKGEGAIPGMTFACVSCHLRSGLGTVEEGIVIPPISGEKLFQPDAPRYQDVRQRARKALPPRRTEYTEETLIKALRTGVNPDGKALSEVMPRYPLSDGDAGNLVAYLRSLSSRLSSGVSATTIRFATVISEDVRPDLREAMLSAITAAFNSWNSQLRAFDKLIRKKYPVMGERMIGKMDLSTRSITLAPWVLKGPPETWRAQLENFHRADPVFALVGGIATGDWKPIHQFSEEHRIPCLFPLTDLPVVSPTDWYTLYLSKGYHQEGESAARYLSTREDLPQGRPVVQIVRASAEAQALSAGFLETLKELERPAAVTVSLLPGKTLDQELLLQVLTTHDPAVLAIWDDASALPALDLPGRADARPAMVLLSGRYLGDGIWTLKETLRDIAYLTYPFALSAPASRTAGEGQKTVDDVRRTVRQSDLPLKNDVQKIKNLTGAMTSLLAALMMDLKNNYYRDYLLDIAGMMPEQPNQLYGRLNFGPGQRYASRGCSIVQVSRGADPELVRKNERDAP